MRRDRGNVIITALFVAIFLFFLSVALLWTNRQDIALSLSMEHRLRANSASRSAALEALARLRDTGGHVTTPLEFPGGVTAQVQLVEIEADELNPKMAELRAQAVSGPVSSYTTVQMLENALASEPEDGDDEPHRALFLVTPEGRSLAIYGDFKKTQADLELKEEDSLACYQGPLFNSRPADNGFEPFFVVDYLPVFSATGIPMAYGPVALIAPNPTDETRLWRLEHQEESFRWVEIPNPDKLGFDPTGQTMSNVKESLNFSGRVGDWTVNSVRAVGQTGNQWVWTDVEPATGGEEDMVNPTLGAAFSVDADLLELTYSEVPNVPPVTGYSLRGSIAAYHNKVYSHAWQYLYRRYEGQPQTPPIAKNVGHQVTRWPCILVYDHETKEWEVAWSTLDERGDVRAREMPDPRVLMVNAEGQIFSQTLGAASRLMQLEDSQVELGASIPANGSVFMYQERPHLLQVDGIQDLTNNELHGFESLLQELPEIAGPIVAPEGTPNNPIEMSLGGGGGQGQAVSLDSTEFRTTRHGYSFTYSIPAGIKPAVDGPDVWLPLSVQVVRHEPTYDYVGDEPMLSDSETAVTFPALARFDGEHWHLLPHGLRPFLSQGPAQRSQLSTSDDYRRLFCAWYEELPPQRPRHTVVNIHHDPVVMR